MNKLWSREEINFLAKNLSRMTYKEIGKKLNRTERAVRSAKYVRFPNLLKIKRWNKKEIKILKEYYPFTPKEELLKKLPNTTWEQILFKAHTLGLRRITGGNSKRMKKLTDFQRGYIAGLIDGEGSICLYPYLGKGRKLNRVEATIQIGNTNKNALEKVKEFTGIGHVYLHNAWKKKNYKPCYTYTINNRIEILQFLLQIKDSLIIKKPQAEVMLEFLRTHRRGEHMSKKDLELIEKMKKLNLRGLLKNEAKRFHEKTEEENSR